MRSFTDFGEVVLESEWRGEEGGEFGSRIVGKEDEDLWVLEGGRGREEEVVRNNREGHFLDRFPLIEQRRLRVDVACVLC